MPTVTLSSAGRFFSSAALSLAAAAASAAASILAETTAGLHSALAFTSALQWALHSALISGGLTSPLHFGSLNSTLQPPEQVPSHLPLAFTEQVALHSPLHSALHTASALPVHLPSQVPAHLPLAFLPSHLPSQVPSHLPEISPLHSPLQVPPQLPSHLAPAASSHVPSHLASHLPLSLPPSQVTLAEPGLTVASHLPAQSAMALTDALQTGGLTSTLYFTPALALTSPMILTAALQAASAFLPGPSSFGFRSASLAPRSLARLLQAVATSASTSAPIFCRSAPAASAPFALPSSSPLRPKFAFMMALASEMLAGQPPGTPGTAGEPGTPFMPQSTIMGKARIKPAPSQALDVLRANIVTSLLGHPELRATISPWNLAREGALENSPSPVYVARPEMFRVCVNGARVAHARPVVREL